MLQRALVLRRQSTKEAGEELMDMLHRHITLKNAIQEEDEQAVQEFNLRIAYWLLA